jgi:uncharacterized protein
MNALNISVDPTRGTVSFAVRVQPKASHDAIAGVVEGALKIRLTAPAIENRANEALVEFLATLLKTSKSAVRIRSGELSRIKLIEILGVPRGEIERLLKIEA